MVSSCQAWQLRWENARPLPVFFRFTHTQPASVGGRFFSSVPVCSTQRRNSQRRGLLIAVMRKKDPAGQQGGRPLPLLGGLLQVPTLPITGETLGGPFQVSVQVPSFWSFGGSVCPALEGGENQDLFVMQSPRV